MMRCPRCGYEWKPKVPNPKECPRCKVRLDYRPSTLLQGAPQKVKEVSEKMTKRLAWVAAAVVIVVIAGLGSWLWLQPTVAQGWNATVSVTGPLSGPVAVGLKTGGYGDYGIENIFIMRHVFKSQWVGKAPEQWENGWYFARLTETENQKDIPYEEPFDILVVYKVRGDNVAYLRFENIYEEIEIISGYNILGGIGKDNRLMSGTDWETVYIHGSNADNLWGYIEGNTYGGVGKDNRYAYFRVYNFIDNHGNGFKLPAGASFSFRLTIYTWK